jgi:magnesium transporter
MQDEAAADLLEELHPAEAAGMVAELAAHDAADIVEHLESDARTAIFEELSDEHVDDILDLLRYPADAAGGLMSAQPATLPLGLTAGEAIEALRQLHQRIENLNYVYVVDDGSRLVGVVSFRDLVFANPEVPLNETMVMSPMAVRPEVDREEVAAIFQRYGLLALPVVDHRGMLLGLVDVDDVIEAVQREATEDLAALVGAGIEETIYTPVRKSIRHRLPWLVLNLGTAFLVTLTISRFEPLISRLAVLAAYMPVVASMGGNGGAQSQAVIIRTLAAHGVPARIQGRVIRREMLVGLWIGLAIGVISGSIAGFFTGQPRIGVVLGLAAVVNLVIATLAGTGIPLLLHRLGKDPALGSNILMTMMTDLFGFGGFLGIAALLL